MSVNKTIEENKKLLNTKNINKLNNKEKVLKSIESEDETALKKLENVINVETDEKILSTLAFINATQEAINALQDRCEISKSK